MNIISEVNRLILITFLIFSIQTDMYSQDRYRSFEPRFSVDLPYNWVKEKPKGPNTNLLLVEKKSGCTIVILVLPHINSRFKDAHDLTKEELSKDLNSGNEEKVLDFKKIYINQQKATCFTTQYRYRSMGIDTMMKSSTYTIIYKDLAYHITVGGDLANYERMLPVFEKTVSSFVIEDDFYKSISTSTSELFVSKSDNFSIHNPNQPNVDKKDNLTTYVFSSLKDTAIYRINVVSNVVYFTKPEAQVEFENKYFEEFITELKNKNIQYSKISYKNFPAIEFHGELLTYGEIPMLGDKANWKSLIIINKDKLYTLQVTSSENKIELNYKTFINNFNFLY